MKFTYMINRHRDLIIEYRDNLMKSYADLNLRPRLDLGDISKVDTLHEFDVDTLLEYDSGDYIFMFGNMVNIDNFNAVVNSIDVGNNLVVFNMKEALSSVTGNISDEQFRRALLTFKLNLDFHSFYNILTERPLSEVSLFSYFFKSLNVVELDINSLYSTLNKILVLSSNAKDYVNKYNYLFKFINFRQNNYVDLDPKLQFVVLSTDTLDEEDSFELNENLKYSCNYRMYNLKTFYNVGYVNVPDYPKKEKPERFDKSIIIDNILEVSEVLDGNIDELFNSNSSSEIHKYVKDFGSKYRNACINELKSKNTLHYRREIPNEYLKFNGKSFRESKTTAYLSELGINSISTIIQDLKVLFKSTDILKVGR